MAEVTREELEVLAKAWRTIGDSLPVRREGEEIPDGENGRFSIGWWRGPCLFWRKGDRMIRMGAHLYADENQHLGTYVEADQRE